MTLPLNSIKWVIGLCLIITLALILGQMRCDKRSGHSVALQSGRYGVVDLAPVRQGQDMTRTFVILNDSKANVIITEIQKTCVCISAELNQQRLKPGEEGTLHLKINTVLQHGPIGGFLSIIWHYEDQPLTHTLKIGFRGNVETVLDITPQVVDFGTVTDNDSIQTQDIQLNRGDFEEDWNSISVRATAGIAKTETSDRASITSELVSLGANRLTFRCIFHSNGHQDQSGKLLINVLEQEKLKTITVPVIAYVP